jgi:dolichol-phosphate mannosyltransferase
MDVSVVIPTFNEAPNLPRLLPRLFEALRGAGMTGEAVISDDASPDGTAEVADGLLRGRGTVIRRTGPRGLALSVADGFARARADALCVMDADLSHPPEVVPALVKALRAGAELAVASRYVPGGGVAGWPWKRRFLSRAACWMALPVTRVRDATSGFFCVRPSVIRDLSLSTRGFKIGLEVFVRGRYTRRTEVPFVFTDRFEGESKLGSGIMVDYLLQILRLVDYRILHR